MNTSSVYCKLRIVSILATLSLFLVPLHTAHAASGTWNGTEDNMWTNSANWSTAYYPAGSESATFDNDGNGNTAISLAGLSSILNISFTNSSVEAYTLGTSGQKVTLLAGANILLAADAANNQAIQADLELPLGNSPVYFRNENPAQTLSFGKVHGYTTPGATKSVYVQGTGPVVIQDDLDRYASGLNLYHQSTNSLTVNGDAQITWANLNGNNAILNIGAGKVMTFSNVGGYNIVASQDATINGPGEIVLSTNVGDDHGNNSVATGKTLTINAKLTGDTGFQFWHESNYGTIVLNGENDYTLSTVINVPGTVQFSTISNKGVAGNLGSGTNIVLDHASCRFLYTGTGETTDRILDVKQGGIFENAGSGTLVFTAPTESSTGGDKTITIRNSATAAAENSGSVQNGSGTVSLTKEGNGEWSLSASNTFSGTLSVDEGTLLLTGSDGSVLATSLCAVDNGATLLLDNTAAVNNTNRLGDTATVALSGGTLRLKNDGGAADFEETAGTLSLVSGNSTVTVDQAAEAHTAILRFASLTRPGAGETIDFTGTGLGESDRCRIFIEGVSDGLIGSWATVNGTETAFYDSTQGICVAPSWAVTNIAARGPDSIIPDDTSADVRITELGVSGPVTLAGDPTNSVAYITQYAATSSVITTSSKTLQTYGIGIAAGASALTIGASTGDGELTTLAVGGNLILDNASDSTLTVNTAIANNEEDSTLTKSGSGDVVIAGPTLYTGSTVIDGGSLTFAGHDVTQHVAGAISGSGSLVKTGTNLLDLVAVNNYSGSTAINQGIVRVAKSGALGSTDSGTVIADGATLDVGGATSQDSLNLRAEPVTVSGNGINGQGAIVNNSTIQQINALGDVTLNGDTAFGGSARWDIRNGTFTMNDHTVTKVGPAAFTLSESTEVTPDGEDASFDIQSGTFRLQQSTQLNGSSTNAVHLQSGTKLEFYDLVASPVWSLICEDNTYYNIIHSDGAHNRWAGPVTLNGTLYLSMTGDNNYYGAINGLISGSGSLFKTNAASLQPHFYITRTNNTYSGSTTVVGGWLHANKLANVGEPSSFGQPMTVEDGTIHLGGGSTPGRIVYHGTGDVTDRILDMSGETGWVTLQNDGTGPLVISNLTVSAGGSKCLYLLGNSASTAEIVAPVVNGSSGSVRVEHQHSGTWILSGDCSYSGSTYQRDGGTLIFKGNNTLTGPTTLDKGIIDYQGDNTLGGVTTMNDGLINYRGNNVLAEDLDINKGTAAIYGTNTYGSGGAIDIGGGDQNGILKLPSGAKLTCASNFMFGNASNSSGAFYLDGGTFINTQSDSDSNFNFGYRGYGYLLMTGGSVSSKRFTIGGGYSTTPAYGTPVIRIKGGTLTFSSYIMLGRQIGSKTSVTLDGGTLNQLQNLWLGPNGGDMELNITGGTWQGPSNYAITYHAYTSAGTSVVNLCAGRLATRNFYNSNGGPSYLMLSGGTLAAVANYSTFVPTSLTGVYSFDAFSSYAGGAVIDTDGKDVTIPASIQAPTGQGVTSISLTDQGSGYIGEPYVWIQGDGIGASAVANIADDGTGNGTFKIASITMTCPGVNYTVTPTVTLRGGGANVQAAVIGAVTMGANPGGGLTKTGEGTLTLSGNNAYAGATTVSNGTLKISTREALPDYTDIHMEGGLLDLGGFLCTNGVVTATAGTIANGLLVADSFTKTGNGLVTLATPLVTDEVNIESGTLSLVTASPGLYEGPLAGSFNTTEDMSTNILTQLTTRMANTNAKPPWTDLTTYLYKGYIWNRETTNVTWTFAESIDDSTLLKIDGVTLLNDGSWGTPTIANHTLTPGAHSFEARFGNGSGGAGRVTTAWWTTTAFGFGVDYQGRNETNMANYVSLTDPGNGTLLTVSGSSSNQISSTASVTLGDNAVLDLAGTLQTLADVSGPGIISNGTLAVTSDIKPGGEGSIGTLTLTSCNLTAGNILIDVATSGDSDCLAIDGDIDLSNATLEIANGEDLDPSKVYTVLTCSGTRTGRFNSISVPDSRWYLVYRADGSIDLRFLSGTLIIIH